MDDDRFCVCVWDDLHVGLKVTFQILPGKYNIAHPVEPTLAIAFQRSAWKDQSSDQIFCIG
ncbi:MAG: hypothetical protein HC785_29475 [Calothrix sp. CSU_2_0]|nr:hypothetical protein [Calothrix sp. CSU_2_0]